MRKSSLEAGLQRLPGKFITIIQVLVFLVSGSVLASPPIPQVNWTLKSVDSEETSSVNGAAVNAFDGDVSTLWHTQLQEPSPRPPHWIDIDLGAIYDLDGFRYLARQDGGVDGRVEIYVFYVSMDGVNWGSPVAAGTLRNTAQEQEVSFSMTQGRFVRFRALTEANGQPWTSVAELNLLGAASTGVNAEPNGVIDTPIDGATVEVGGTLNFTGSGSDPDSNALLSYLWTFGDPTVADLEMEDPYSVVFNTPGTHTVTLTAIDHLGLADSTPATIQVRVEAPSVTRVISRTGWSLLSVDSEKTSGEDGVATNAFDGDVNTFWHTQYQGSNPSHPHWIDIDLGTVQDLDGFRYLPRQDGGVNGRVGEYAFYVSMDGVTWGSPVATGTFQNTAQEQEVLFAMTQGQYVRFEALSEVNSQPWTSVAELNLLGIGKPIGQTITATPIADRNAQGVLLYHDFNDVTPHTYTQSDITTTWNSKSTGLEPDAVSIVPDPDPSGSHGNVMQVFHAGNSVLRQNNSGSQWRTNLGKQYDELYLAYDVFFTENPEFVLGGKLPGLMGGPVVHAGGTSPDGTDGWSGRLAWKDGGKLAGYMYVANKPVRFGWEILWDDGLEAQAYLNRGSWNRLEMRYVMNTPGIANGIIQAWLNGNLALDRRNLLFRSEGGNQIGIDQFFFSSFYGGSAPIFAPANDQYICYDNFVVSTQPITH